MKKIDKKECDIIGDIKEKKDNLPSIDITEKKLRNLYLVKKLTMDEISKIIGRSQKYAAKKFGH